MSDRENDLGAAEQADDNAPGTASESKSKPKRARRSTDKPVKPAAKEEAADMVSEGGPVGDEQERQLGVTELPAETVEKETKELEKSHPALADDAAPARGTKAADKPKADATAAKAVAAKPATSSRKKPATTSCRCTASC